MPQLNFKGYGRNKHIEKSTLNPHNPEDSSRKWDICINIPNLQKLYQIKQFFLVTRQWAFVWCRRDEGDNYYFLIGCVVFPVPHTASWLRANLGGGYYHVLTKNEELNHYRNHQMDLAEGYEEIGQEFIILIDDGYF
jgi:hypothetical protein